MMHVILQGQDLYMTILANVTDDSETLSFYDADPGESDGRFLAGLTWYDRKSSPLLVHIPEEIDYVLLERMVTFALEWISDNAPYIRIELPAGSNGRARPT